MARVVIVSNRVPVPSFRGARAGGLTVALRDVFKSGALWLGWSGEIAAETCTTAKIERSGKFDFATLDLSEEDYKRFYVGFANSVLWPLLHFQPGLLEFDREDFEAYLDVNRTYAKALVPLLKPTDLIVAISLARMRFEEFQRLAREASNLRQALEDRKLTYVHLANGAEPQSQSSVSLFPLSTLPLPPYPLSMNTTPCPL